MLATVIDIDLALSLVSCLVVADDIVNEIGGLNELMDIMKCGSASGVIMALIYLITVIVLMICGFLGIF